MAQVDTRDWLRNAAGWIWVEALDGPPPDVEPSLEQLIDSSAVAIAEDTPPEPTPAAGNPPPPRLRVNVAVQVVCIVAALALMIVGTRPGTQSVPMSAPTVAPTRAATIGPTAAPAAVRMIVAWWSPGGQALAEPIREADAYRFVGRLGDSWVRVQLPGGGLVWVRRADLHPDGADLTALAALPDLTPPTPAPTPPIVVAPPAAIEAPAAPQAPVPTATPLVVPPLRFPMEAPDALPSPRRVGEKPSERRAP